MRIITHQAQLIRAPRDRLCYYPDNFFSCIQARRPMLNTLWFAFFIIALAAGLYHWVFLQDSEVFSRIVLSLFDMAELSVELMILLFGTLTLWLGFLRIAEGAGLIHWLSPLLSALFRLLMQGVPAGHAAVGSGRA